MDSPTPTLLTQQFAWVYSQRTRELSKYRDTRRYIAALDCAHIARAQAGAVGQLLLRYLSVMTCPTQIPRHDLLEIHGAMGTRIGMIVLGTIVPIRARSCYSHMETRLRGLFVRCREDGLIWWRAAGVFRDQYLSFAGSLASWLSTVVGCFDLRQQING